jgi:hypothetical protein
VGLEAETVVVDCLAMEVVVVAPSWTQHRGEPRNLDLCAVDEAGLVVHGASAVEIGTEIAEAGTAVVVLVDTAELAAGVVAR